MLVNNHHLPQHSPSPSKTREYQAIGDLAHKSGRETSKESDISISFDAKLRLEHENSHALSEHLQRELMQKTSDNIENIHTFLQAGIREQNIDEVEYPIYLTYHPTSKNIDISSTNPDVAFHLSSLVESEKGDLFHTLSKETFSHMQKLGASSGNHFELDKTYIAAQQANESLSFRISD